MARAGVPKDGTLAVAANVNAVRATGGDGGCEPIQR